MLEEQILPDALRDVDLGSDVIEIGPGPGLTTDVLRKQTDDLVAVAVDPDLAALLETRLRGTNVKVMRGDATAPTSAQFSGHVLGTDQRPAFARSALAGL